MWLKMFAQIRRYFIFIRIKDIRLFSALIQCFHDPVQCLWCQQIVMVKQTGIFSGCHLHRCIRIFRDSEIFFQILHFYSGIFRGVFPEYFRHRCILGACIGDTQFPVCICLHLQ